MQITSQTILRYCRKVEPTNDSAVAAQEQKAMANLQSLGFQFDGIHGIKYATSFTAREMLRQTWAHRLETEHITEITQEERPEIEKKAAFNSKGLLLVGPCGRGKTRLAQWIAANTRAEYYTMAEIDEAYALTSYEEFKKNFETLFSSLRVVIIDDLGSESGIRRFGNESFSAQIIEKMYSRWQVYGTPCVITTNLTPNPVGGHNAQPSILSQYGERALSRLNEMCDLILFSGMTDYRFIR